MKSLVKNTAMVGGTEFMLLFVSLIRNKYLALTIGTEGYGIVSLLTSFFQYANLIAGSWMSTASLKYISEYNSEGKEEEVKILFNLTYYIVVLSASVIAIAFVVFFPVIQRIFLSKEVLFSYYALFAAGFWGTSLANIFRVLLQGMMDIKTIVKIRIITQVVNLLTVLLLVFLFDMVGLFINIAVIALFTALLYYLVVRKKVKIKKFDLKWYKTKISKKVFSFSVIDVFLGFIDQTANYLKRILVINFLSMSSLGLLAAVRGLNKYLGMVNRSSMFYFKPKMSQSLSTKDRYKGLNDYFRLMLLVGGLGSILVVLFSYEVVWLLYSREFLRVTSVIFIFVLSQYISSIQVGYMFSVVGMAKMRVHSLAILVSTPFAIIIPYFYLMYEPAALGIIYQSVFPFAKMSAAELKVVLGLISIGLGGLTVVALRIIIYGTYLSKVHHVMMNRSNLILLSLGSGLIVFSNYLLVYALAYRIGFAFLVIFASILLLNKQEKNWIIKIVKEKILHK